MNTWYIASCKGKNLDRTYDMDHLTIVQRGSDLKWKQLVRINKINFQAESIVECGIDGEWDVSQDRNMTFTVQNHAYIWNLVKTMFTWQFELFLHYDTILTLFCSIFHILNDALQPTNQWMFLGCLGYIESSYVPIATGWNDPTAVFPERLNFFTVCLVNYLCEVLPWLAPKGKFLKFRSPDCWKMHFWHPFWLQKHSLYIVCLQQQQFFLEF